MKVVGLEFIRFMKDKRNWNFPLLISDIINLILKILLFKFPELRAKASGVSYLPSSSVICEGLMRDKQTSWQVFLQKRINSQSCLIFGKNEITFSKWSLHIKYAFFSPKYIVNRVTLYIKIP